MCCWIWFSIIEDFCINVHHRYWPVVFFFKKKSVSLPDFGIRMMMVSSKKLGRSPSFCIVWNSFNRNGTSSSFYVWENSAVNLSGPGLFLVSRLLIAASTSDLVIGLLRVSTSSWLSLGSV